MLMFLYNTFMTRIKVLLRIKTLLVTAMLYKQMGLIEVLLAA